MYDYKNENIEVRIDAPTEKIARRYASMHFIDMKYAKWSNNSNDKGGRFYCLATKASSSLAIEGGTIWVATSNDDGDGTSTDDD